MKHPHRTYEMLTAHVEGALAGYLIAGSEETGSRIVDWFGAPPDGAAKAGAAAAKPQKTCGGI